MKQIVLLVTLKIHVKSVSNEYVLIVTKNQKMVGLILKNNLSLNHVVIVISICAVTCGAWRALVRREPEQGDVAGDGTLELWSLCGWAQIRVEVTLRFLWELWSAD